MRTRGGLIGAALLAAACGSSKGPAGTTTGGPGLSPAGTACASSRACASGVCGVTDDGGGNCCAKACGNDPLCGATACDATGACVYRAAGTQCGASCANAILSTRTCDGSGVCQPADGGNPCPDNLACADFAGCNQTCVTPFDCATGFTCKGGVCFAQIATGPCSSNLDCASGVCGLSGTGNCCATPCKSISLDPCGASDCDRVSGACLYADAGTRCGTMGCSPDADPPSTSLCNGFGTCTPISCAPYLCGPDACLSSCTNATACSPGDFCDTTTLGCCGALADGATIHVDWTVGSDFTPCCGFAGAPPCQTLTHARTLLALAGVRNATLWATVGSDGGDWPLYAESYPFTLGEGLELLAPGVYFQSLDIATTENDAGFDGASIVGTADHPVVIGLSSTGQTTSDGDAITVELGNTLYLANVRVYSDAAYFTAALTVLGGGTLVLGQDRSAGVTGTVHVGDPAIPGYIGIQCEGDGYEGCTISEAPSNGMRSVVVENQAGALLYAWGPAPMVPSSISLTSSPIFGEPPSSPGFEKCPAKSGDGIDLDGNVDMVLENGTVQCLEGSGLELDGAGDAGPNLTVTNTTIQNTDTGVNVSAGKLAISNSIIRYNYVGVLQGGDDDGGSPLGTIDLSGGGQGGTNTVVCTSSSEANPSLPRPFPAMAVLNMSSATIDASNVSWDTPGPDQFTCDPTGTMCTCANPMCANPGGVDGMDAVNMATGKITTTGHTLSVTNCAPPTPCASNPCPAGQFCCADFAYCLPFPCPG